MSARTAILAHSATIAHSTSTLFLSNFSSPLSLSRSLVRYFLDCLSSLLQVLAHVLIDSSRIQPFSSCPLPVVSNAFLSDAQLSFQVDRASVSLALSHILLCSSILYFLAWIFCLQHHRMSMISPTCWSHIFQPPSCEKVSCVQLTQYITSDYGASIWLLLFYKAKRKFKNWANVDSIWSWRNYCA